VNAKTIVDDVFRRGFAPPPKLSVSQWADGYRVLSSESGAAAGQWHTLPFQREVFDAFSDPAVHTLVIMSATQMLKTETILNCLGFIIDRDPGPTLLVVPRDADGDRFSKIRLAPMVRDTECLRMKLVDVRGRGRTSNTLDHKSFPGGHLTIAAAGSPGNLGALPIRYLLCDEIDKYLVSSGSEGDPLSLAAKRQATFWNRKTVLCCSPTIDGESRIQKAFLDSDQREYFVPCPACGVFQTLDFRLHVKWDNTLPTKEQRAATAHYECEKCSAHWNDVDRWREGEQGRWNATATFAGTAGFRISELCSPWKKLSEIVLDFLTKKDDPMQLMTFVNTSLAETWKDRGQQPVWEKLYARREDYELGVVPARALMLIAAVDCQHNRLEFEAIAYAPNRESWSIYYDVIAGDPNDVSGSGPWARLEDILALNWPHELGGVTPILALAIDSGNNPSPVYQFAARHAQPVWTPAGTKIRQPRTVIAVKGNDDAFKVISNVSGTDAARKRNDIRIWTVGTHFCKQEFYDLLRLTPFEGGAFPPGYIHLPMYEKAYFQGLCSETRIVHANGKIEWKPDPSIRNEPLDLRVYCRAVAELVGLFWMRDGHWAHLEAMVSQKEVL